MYDTQPPETKAVHSLEHGAVFVYYLPEAEGGISQELIDRLATDRGGEQRDVPRPVSHTHRGDRTHAHRVEPTSILSGRVDSLTPEAAATIVNGFVTAFECTGNAPENSNAPC